MANIFNDRIECWKDTQQCNLPVPKSIKVVYSKEPFKKIHPKSEIKFFDEDAIDLGLKFKNALVLNLADDNFAGGCVDVGSGAQEESLFRRTNLFKTLKQSMYPIKNNEAIYSPGVSVIKDTEQNKWKRYRNPKKLSFIACPGIKYPVTEKHRLSEKDVKILRKKIKIIIQTAVRFGHDTIIFGAMGCGAWRNPVDHVAEIFKNVLEKYSGVVQNYYFAILSTPGDYIVRNHNHNKVKSIDTFKSIFNLKN
jgi:uncharacterized protein (TIGR02452 family)